VTHHDTSRQHRITVRILVTGSGGDALKASCRCCRHHWFTVVSSHTTKFVCSCHCPMPAAPLPTPLPLLLPPRDWLIVAIIKARDAYKDIFGHGIQAKWLVCSISIVVLLSHAMVSWQRGHPQHVATIQAASCLPFPGVHHPRKNPSPPLAQPGAGKKRPTGTNGPINYATVRDSTDCDTDARGVVPDRPWQWYAISNRTWTC